MSSAEPPIRLANIFYREASPDYAVRAHSHAIHQWYAVVHGSVEMRLGGSVHLLRAGESVLVEPGREREPSGHQGSPGYLCALFENRALSLKAASGRRLRLGDNLREDFHALVEELRRPGGADSAVLVEALLVRLLVGLRRQCAAERGEGPSPLHATRREDLAARVTAFLRANLHLPLTRADIARAVNLSPSHCARLFRAATGETLLERLTGLRMQRARALLLESTLPITQIALEVGFSSFSHFSQRFRAAAGLTPSEYRITGGAIYAMPPETPARRKR
jgi:AraC-like DNA-binding protein